MNTAARIFVTFAMGLCFAVGCQTGVDGLGPTGDPVPGEQEPQGGQGEQEPQGGQGGQEPQGGQGEPGTQGEPGPPNGQGGPGQEQSAAEQLQQTLSGKRLTYLTSSGNGQVYTSQREDIDLCSSGQFQIRTVSQTAGYGGANEDVYEAIGTWRVVAAGTQLLVELDRQQATDGYTGINAYPVELGSASELYFNGARYDISPNSPVCN